jgi:hypothetical protein
LNLYSYGRDNPITLKDSSGKCVEDGCSVEAVSLGALAGALSGIGSQYASDVFSNIHQSGGFTLGDSYASSLFITHAKGGVAAWHELIVGGGAMANAIVPTQNCEPSGKLADFPV